MDKFDETAPGAADAVTKPAVVHTAAGDLRGEHLAGVYRFCGVRYGEDTSSRRFQPAEPVRAWEGIRDALAFGDQCIQPATPDIKLLSTGWDQPTSASEDCLSLNIWTPAIDDGKRRPVMFNLHGGGWTVGNGASAGRSGEKFARHHDVVRVNVNHRLGIFGYSYLEQLLGPEYADSGNVGILDVVLALEWVRDNIVAFGGDPDNVTIFGVSGGGQKVSTLMTMPAAKGLFHRASVESGPMLTATLPAAADKAARELLTVLDIGDRPEELLSLSGEQLLDGYMKMYPDGGLGSAVIGPVVDGRNLPSHPFDPTAPEASNDIPLIIGATATESSLFLGADPSIFDLTWEGLAAMLPLMVPQLSSSNMQETIADAQRMMPNATPADILFVFTTEVGIRGPSIRQAERAAQRPAPVYMWHLEWTTPVDDGKWRTPHGISVPLIMDTVYGVPSMFGDKLDEAQLLADKMSGAWAQFARTGVPNIPGLPDWPAYEANERNTMIFDNECHVVSDPASELRQMFEHSVGGPENLIPKK